MGLSNAERQARWRAKRDAEIERLRKASAKAAPFTDTERRELAGKWMRAQLEVDRLRRELAEARKSEPEQLAPLRKRVSDLEQTLARREKAAQAKAAKPPPDPDSKELKALQRKLKQSLFSVRTKISRALTEQTTDAPTRLAALKAWNALGANKGQRR